MLLAAGLLRLGTYIKFIPYPVTVGFTAGIAVIILASQLKDAARADASPGRNPGRLLEKLPVLWARAADVDRRRSRCRSRRSRSSSALKRWRPQWPGMLIAVAPRPSRRRSGSRSRRSASPLAASQRPAVAGAARRSSWDKVRRCCPTPFAFALLGAIESLLSAVVADGMTGRRHRSNCELVAQGVANVASGLFGGICVTGTIARTATNVRAGAHGPVAGMLHSVFLLLFVLVAAPLASYIPLAASRACWPSSRGTWSRARRRRAAPRLARRRGRAARHFPADDFRELDRSDRRRLRARLGAVHPPHGAVRSRSPRRRGRHRPAEAADPAAVVYRIRGAMFFGAASAVAAALDRIDDAHRVLVVDFAEVTLIDSSAANMIEGLAAKSKAARDRGLPDRRRRRRCGASCWLTACGRRRCATPRRSRTRLTGRGGAGSSRPRRLRSGARIASARGARAQQFQLIVSNSEFCGRFTIRKVRLTDRFRLEPALAPVRG